MLFSLEDLETLRENVDLELKAAQGRDGQGKLPQSLWTSYSAMANTQGGQIVLGICEDSAGAVEVLGIRRPEQVIKEFWNTLNDRKKISINLLRDEDVSLIKAGERQVIVIQIPRARRTERPVYVGANPFTGTYRRNYDGDYHCPEDVVRRLIADAGEESQDALIHRGFELADVDPESLAAYRNLFRSTRPGHPWLTLDDRELMKCIGGLRRDRQTGSEGLTSAGLLMFGRLPAILEAFPGYLVDYREEDPQAHERYLDRITTDGSWAGNLFSFFRRVYPKLVAELKIPFSYRPGSTSRLDETPIHEALREALTNAIIHADQMGRTGIVVVKAPHRFTFRNPGGLRLPLEVVFHGGVTDCRNRHLQGMFQLIGEGEKMGSGLPWILHAWREQHWRSPVLREQQQPEWTELVLTAESLFPEAALAELDRRYGEQFPSLDEPRRLAVATAMIEGRVDNQRLRELSDQHPSDVTRLFADLFERRLLSPKGARRGKYYVIPGNGGLTASGKQGPKVSPQVAASGEHRPKSSPQVVTSRPKSPQVVPKSCPSEEEALLLELAREARSLKELMSALGFKDRKKLTKTLIQPLLDAGWLARAIPDKPRSSQQRYVTTAEGEALLIGLAR